ncbi:MAG TPA: MBL fold metallo-hydrolase [Chlamydiales bacterium]
MNGFCPLASGSKGNSIFFGTEKTRILIDAGLSARALLEKLQEIVVDPQTIEAILVTHEHTDHIAGLATLSERLNIPIFANAETAKGIVAALNRHPRFKIFATGETFQFGDLSIHPFSVPHDTLDPVAFTIRTPTCKVGLCTDLGHTTSLIRKHLEKCDYLYLEANHEPSMVHACGRPQVYKTRVLGKQGHLSNEECGKLLDAVFHDELKHVHLAHLSSECNAEEKALEVVKKWLGDRSLELSIAYQAQISRAILF